MTEALYEPASNEAVASFAPPAYLAAGQSIVVKIGSALLVDPETGGLRAEWLRGLAADVAELRATGKRVALVSSGAIALGRGILGLPRAALPLEQAQAAAAAGQIALARAYAEAFAPHGIHAGQVLLTLDDTKDRRRYLNGRATLATLLDLGVLPIVNENDTVATDEIRYGDNDRLAARVALMTSADRLILLSDIDGLYTANPATDPTARRLDLVSAITPEIEGMAGGALSALSKGGMRTKILAAKTALQGGCAMVIARGDRDHPLAALKEGAPCTWFVPSDTPQNARKQWIAGLRSEGTLSIDDGAATALRAGRSLLPAGVRNVEGRFGRGEPITLTALDGKALGAAICAYTADETRLIAGRQSTEIEPILGYPGRAAVVHRDDMVLWD